MAVAQSRRTHCPHGHRYDAGNTCLSGGRRHCLACQREKRAARRAPPPTWAEILNANTQIGETPAHRPDLGPCLIWTGPIHREGYGQRAGKLAHRLAYEHEVGPIPDGLTLDHLCRTRACVRAGHLEPVSLGVNVLRGESLPARNARKTHCPKGHPYDDANTYRNPTTGHRLCRACAREAQRNRRKEVAGKEGRQQEGRQQEGRAEGAAEGG